MPGRQRPERPATVTFETAFTELMWVAWRTVGLIVARVWAAPRARSLQRSRYALWKNPGNRTDRQRQARPPHRRAPDRDPRRHGAPLSNALVARPILSLGGHRPALPDRT